MFSIEIFLIIITKRNGIQIKNGTFSLLLLFIYTTLITVLIDLNIAVISGTIIFYIGKRYFGFVDTEGDFLEVHGENIHGVEVE